MESTAGASIIANIMAPFPDNLTVPHDSTMGVSKNAGTSYRPKAVGLLQ